MCTSVSAADSSASECAARRWSVYDLDQKMLLALESELLKVPALLDTVVVNSYCRRLPSDKPHTLPLLSWMKYCRDYLDEAGLTWRHCYSWFFFLLVCLDADYSVL